MYVPASSLPAGRLANCPQTMKVICKDRRQKSKSSGPEARGVSSVAADVDRLLNTKSLEELEALEKQIRRKLESNEPIDVDYWEHLLRSLLVWKAKAKLRRLSQTIISSRLQGLRKQQEQEALGVQEKLRDILGVSSASQSSVAYTQALDPEPFLKLRSEDKALESVDEKTFLDNVVSTCSEPDLSRLILTFTDGGTPQDPEAGIRSIQAIKH